MVKAQSGLPSLVAGFYAALVALFSGAILMDIVYARRLSDLLGAAERAPLFAGIADLLLLVGFFAVLAAIGAIAASWRSKRAMLLCIASLFALSLEFLAPFFIAPFLRQADAPHLGPWLRVLPAGAATLLAILAVYQNSRQA